MKYIIKKGRHYANFTINRLFPFTSSSIKGSVKFSKECLVQGDISGWNKLCGITSPKIHENSGRLVWMSDGELIRIAAYVYKDGVRKSVEIIKLPVEMYFSYSIKYTHNTWVFTINGYKVILPGSLGFFKFKAYPYFGGQSTAPIQMSINLI